MLRRSPPPGGFPDGRPVVLLQNPSGLLKSPATRGDEP